MFPLQPTSMTTGQNQNKTCWWQQATNDDGCCEMRSSPWQHVGVTDDEPFLFRSDCLCGSWLSKKWLKRVTPAWAVLTLGVTGTLFYHHLGHLFYLLFMWAASKTKAVNAPWLPQQREGQETAAPDPPWWTCCCYRRLRLIIFTSKRLNRGEITGINWDACLDLDSVAPPAQLF